MTVAETSREAYFQMDQMSLGRKQRAVLAFIRKYGPLNNRQLSERMGWPINRITPRVLELRELGLVVSAGKETDPTTGLRAEQWQVSR